MNDTREKLINIILKVAMQHHDDISKSDEDAACTAVDEILKQYPQLTFPLISENQDGDCYYCGEKTDSLIGNPSMWPLKFCHKDDPGKVKYHHIGCVIERLDRPTLYFLTTKRDVNAKDDHDRCVGYYTSLEIAREVLNEHCEMLEEGAYYQYVIIESFESGWYPHAKIEEWYEFINNGKQVHKIEKPKKYSYVCNFGIG